MKKYSEGKDYKVIAYCISRFHREEQKEDINYMCRFAREYHCKVFIFSTLTDLYYDDINDQGEKQIYSMLQVGAFDAVVIMSETFKKTKVDREIADCAIQAGVPVISVNRQLKGCTNIDFTYAETFEAIVRHIVEFHGCRRINYIGGDTVSKFSEERLEAYKKVLKENGIPFEEKRTGYGNFRKQQALEVLDRFLKEKELPEAIICANDVMAVAVCSKLRTLGLRVPEDIKVTGFDGDEVEKYHNPRLTTAAYDWEKTARTIFEVAVDLAEGKKVQEPVWIPYVRQVGHSCGCTYNHVYSATERLFDARVYQGDYDDYYQRIMNMSSKANKCEEFSEVISVAEELSKSIRYKEFWFCFLEESYQKIIDRMPSEVEFEQNTNPHNQTKLSASKIVVASYVSEQKQQEIQCIEFREMVPQLEALLEKEDYIMFIPMHLQGLFIGYIGVTFDIQQTDFGFLNLFTLNMRNIIESYWSRIAQEQLMIKDELTNLYNSKGFKKKILKLFSSGNVKYITLLVMDMDNFKPINDTYGHEEGDQIIKQVAKILEKSITREELCARMEGDGFAVVSTSNKGGTRGQEIQDSIERGLIDYNLISGKPYELEASIGYCSGQDVDILDFKTLYSQADKAAYNNKRSHKAR